MGHGPGPLYLGGSVPRRRPGRQTVVGCVFSKRGMGQRPSCKKKTFAWVKLFADLFRACFELVDMTFTGPKMERLMKTLISALTLTFAATSAFAAGHAAMPSVEATNQSVADGVVSAEMVVATQNGWMVVHRTDMEMKPGPVVGYAPLRMGDNVDVAAILTEEVAPGEMLMLMVHSEAGGVMTGGFEYTLGAVEDGPIRIDGDLVMTVITAE